MNLEATGLTYDMIKELLGSIKQSRSLQAIHLCGNPGVNQIQLIHDTVEMLNPVNFSQWDDMNVVGMHSHNTGSRRNLASSKSNKSLKSNYGAMKRDRSQTSHMSRRDVYSGDSGSRRQRTSQHFDLGGLGSPTSQMPQKKKGGGILKQPTTFADHLSEDNQTPLEARDLSSSEDNDGNKRDKPRKGPESALDYLQKGLRTKRFKT